MGMTYPCVIFYGVIKGLIGVMAVYPLAFQCTLVGVAILAKGLKYILVKRFNTNVLPCKQVIHFGCGGYLTGYCTRLA